MTDAIVTASLLRYFPGSDTALTIGGLDGEQLAATYGTPLYVFDAATLRDRVRSVRNAFGEAVDVLFALKANPNVAVARVLRRMGLGVELASAGEILVAEAAGFQGATAQFSGPAKSERDFIEAMRFGLGVLNLESETEYERLASLAERRELRPRVAVRVNLPSSVKGARMRMGGGTQKFGVALEAVPALVDRICREGILEFRGFHTYAGTQCFDAAAWVDHARLLLELAARVESDLATPVASLNFGGGFGVPCFEGDVEFDIALAGRELSRALLAGSRPGRAHVLELGRYLTAPAGVYLTRVTDLKQSRGRRHVLVDGGLHHHAAAAGVGSPLPRSFPMVRVREPHADPTDEYCVGGPLCTPIDRFSDGTPMAELKVGDLLAVLMSGAYGLTFSNVLFLGHPAPAELLVDDGRASIVRERGRPEDALQGQVLLESRLEEAC